MKNFYLFTLIAVSSLLISCSNDDDNSFARTKYIKNSTRTDISNPTTNSFEFNEGILINATGSTSISGNYEYDFDGRLIKKTKENFPNTFIYTYEYDDQNRIIKRNTLGNDDYIELVYEQNKVLTKRYLEYTYSANEVISVFEEYELLLDPEGKIVKMINLTQEPDLPSSQIEYIEYLYDENNNITKVITQHSNSSNLEIRNIKYDDKINPYYIAFKKFYNLTYYLENYNGLSFGGNFLGLTPNNITEYDQGRIIIDYTYDNEGYPTSWIEKSGVIENGIISQGVFEYYE